MTLSQWVESLRTRRIAVIGIGVSNRPLIRLLLEGGCQVTACDKRSREELEGFAETVEALGGSLRLGPDYLEGLEEDLIFRTPGMHPLTPALAEAGARGAEITSEMEAFFSLCPCKILAVTGSDGKTTTTTLIAELLKAAGYTVHVGGNIGTPLLCRVDEMAPTDMAVLELSSFQLHSMTCAPDTAVVTNLSPNHLDVHPDMEDYVTAKMNIFLHQRPTGRTVFNAGDARTPDFIPRAPGKVLLFSSHGPVETGIYRDGDALYRADGGKCTRLMDIGDIRIPGDHNVENYMAAYAAVEDLVSPEILRQVARSFAGVEHRLEIVRVRDGVTFINDSIASSPTRTIAGLKALKTAPILIAGGYDKKIPFDTLGPEIAARCKAVYLTGHTAEKIAAAIDRAGGGIPVTLCGSFREAVLAAAAYARPGDTVLLSPACASFDLFKNFAERGNTFRQIVMEL